MAVSFAGLPCPFRWPPEDTNAQMTTRTFDWLWRLCQEIPDEINPMHTKPNQPSNPSPPPLFTLTYHNPRLINLECENRWFGHPIVMTRSWSGHDQVMTHWWLKGAVVTMGFPLNVSRNVVRELEVWPCAHDWVITHTLQKSALSRCHPDLNFKLIKFQLTPSSWQCPSFLTFKIKLQLTSLSSQRLTF